MLAEHLQSILDLTRELQVQWRAQASPESIDALLDQREALIERLQDLQADPTALGDPALQALQAQIQTEAEQLFELLQQSQLLLQEDQQQLRQTRSAFAAYESSDLPEAHFIERET